MNKISNQEILDNCDPFHKSEAFASEQTRQCCGEVLGQVSRAYGHSIRLSEIKPVVMEIILRAIGAVNRNAFEAGQAVEPLPDERRVKNQMMQWAGIPVWVDGVVTTNPDNWPLIDSNDSTPKSPGEPFPDRATCTQDVQAGFGTAAP